MLKNHSTLIDSEIRIKQISERITKIENGNWILNFFFLDYLKRRLERLEAKQFYSVDKYLCTNDENYLRITKQSQKLLETNQIEFVIYDQDFPFLGTYTKKVEGSIHSNGFSYSYSIQSNLAIIPFDNLRYTSEMTGMIDYWGRINLKTTRTKYALFKTVPKRFLGIITSEGLIQLQNIENEFDIFTSGMATIGKLIANHFGGDVLKEQEFFKNKDLLTKMVLEFRKNLIK